MSRHDRLTALPAPTHNQRHYAADDEQRTTEGRIATEQEPRGVIRNRFLDAERKISYEETKGMSPLLGGPAYYARQALVHLEAYTAGDSELTNILRNIEKHSSTTASAVSGPVPGGRQE